MTRSDLIERLAERYPNLATSEFDQIVRLIFETISQHLVAGGAVELRGFASFSTRPRPGRIGRDPRNGEPVEVNPKRGVYFRAGKELREMGVRAGRTSRHPS
jgi:nucleoid DNA-binding protein